MGERSPTPFLYLALLLELVGNFDKFGDVCIDKLLSCFGSGEFSFWTYDLLAYLGKGKLIFGIDLSLFTILSHFLPVFLFSPSSLVLKSCPNSKLDLVCFCFLEPLKDKRISEHLLKSFLSLNSFFFLLVYFVGNKAEDPRETEFDSIFLIGLLAFSKLMNFYYSRYFFPIFFITIPPF